MCSENKDIVAMVDKIEQIEKDIKTLKAKLSACKEGKSSVEQDLTIKQQTNLSSEHTNSKKTSQAPAKPSK